MVAARFSAPPTRDVDRASDGPQTTRGTEADSPLGLFWRDSPNSGAPRTRTPRPRKLAASFASWAAVEPDRYRPNLAAALTNLGGTLSALGSAQEAHAATEEGTRLYRELAAAEPDRYRRQLASTLDLLAECLDALGRVDDAKNARDEREQLLVELIRGE